MKEVLNSKNQKLVRSTKSALAKKLGISRGALNYTHKRPLTDEKLKADIEQVLKDNPGYGHKRIALELKLNRKRILRVMKKFHLMPKRRRRQGFIKPDDLDKPETKYLNLIESFCPRGSCPNHLLLQQPENLYQAQNCAGEVSFRQRIFVQRIGYLTNSCKVQDFMIISQPKRVL